MGVKMSMKRNIVFAMLVLITFASCSKNTLPAEKKDCGKLEQKIKNSISLLNYCNKDDECVAVNISRCPFGCYWLVNKKASVSKVNTQINIFFAQGCEKGCRYKCGGISKNTPIKCKKKKCAVEYNTK